MGNGSCSTVRLVQYNTRLRGKSDTLSPKLVFRIAHVEPVGSKAQAENPGKSQLEVLEGWTGN